MEVPPFYLSNGVAVITLRELRDEIAKNPQVVASHITSERNDFANWIRGALYDEPLARQIDKCTEPHQVIDTLTRHLDYGVNTLAVAQSHELTKTTARKPVPELPPSDLPHQRTGELKYFLIGILLGIGVGVVVMMLINAL